MIQIEPGENVPITRQLDDPLDAGTYFVQAYVRNATTDALIATVNLTDKGSQRFRGVWQAIQDVESQGLYITITSKVFTDSGYTTPASSYGLREDTYLIQQRYNREKLGAFLGPQSGVDYTKIKELIDGRKNLGGTEQAPVDLVPVTAALTALTNLCSSILEVVQAIEMPEIPKVDLTRLEAHGEAIMARMEALHDRVLPRAVEGKIDTLGTNHKALRDEMTSAMAEFKGMMEQAIQQLGRDINSFYGEFEGLKKKLGAMKVTAKIAMPDDEEELTDQENG